MIKIWCLFSIDNNYDQPRNNLVAWWNEKPGLSSLCEALGATMKTDEDIVNIVRLSEGEERKMHETWYRLEQIPEGKLP